MTHEADGGGVRQIMADPARRSSRLVRCPNPDGPGREAHRCLGGCRESVNDKF